MSKTGILLSFYPSQKDANKALQRLHRRLFRRAALIGKSTSGAVHTENVSPRYWARWGGLSGLALGMLVASVTIGIDDLFTQLGGYSTLGVSAVAGALMGWIAARTF
jgi:hypothetical protein